MLKSNKHIRVQSTEKLKRYPRCGSIKKVKNEFNRGNFEKYTFDHLDTKNSYSDSIGLKDV